MCIKSIYNSIAMLISTILANTTENVTPGVVTLDFTWASDLLAFLGILGIVATGVAFWVRYEVKKNFIEIKSEFKPNGGSSLRDQVNRLESRHDDLDHKVDTMENSINRMDGKVDTIINFLQGKQDKN